MKLLSSLYKELLILSRDRTGLLLLFVMPAFLVVVITLIQDNASTTTVELLLVDEDNSSFTKNISFFLEKNSAVISREHNGRRVSAAEAKRLVGVGKYQFALYIPKGTAAALQKSAYQQSQAILGGTDFAKEIFVLDKAKTAKIEQARQSEEREKQGAKPHLTLWFSPTVDGTLQLAIRSAMECSMQEAAMQAVLAEIEKTPATTAFSMIPAIPSKTPQSEGVVPILSSLITIDEEFSSSMNFAVRPTAVQQNVPAWAIFGIFFIAVPLAGSFLHEKQNGTLLRLAAMPVSHATIFAGKLIAYGVICMIQFGVIFSTGYFLLPFLGLPAFDSCGQWTGITLLLLAVSAAACSYGTLLGAWGKSYDQIAVFAPVSIVIAAALGGIMVPAFSLPALLREAGKISPLYWAQNGFYDLLLRGGTLQDILPELGSLMLFAAVCFTAAYLAGLRGR